MAGNNSATDGNLQSVTGTQSHTLAYDIDNDQADDCDLLTKMDSQSISWDDNGNMVAGLNTLSTTWNWDHKLRCASVGSDGISCKYVPDGAMVYKESTVSCTTTKRKYILDYVGSIPKILLAVDPDTSEVKKTYIHADNEVLLQHDGDYNDDRYFYLHDRLGSVRQIIASDGTTENIYTYDPWGLPITSECTETIANDYQFAGYFWDPEPKGYNCDQREYDPITARFTRQDPILGDFQQPLTLHAYLYCLNNPINSTDRGGCPECR